MDLPPDRVDGERVVLRRAQVADAAMIAATVAANMDHLVGWMAWAPTAAVTADGQLERLREGESKWAAGTDFGYLILSADGTTHLGMAGLHRRIGPGGIEIGYWIGKDHEGRGYVTEAARLLTDAALRLSDVERVEIHCDEANLRSAAVPARLGYRLDRVEDKPPTAPLESGRNQVWVRIR